MFINNSTMNIESLKTFLHLNCEFVFKCLNMNIFLNRLVQFSTTYPVTRGMVSYAVIWPTGCILQQMAFGDNEFDFVRAARFGLFGAFYVAPTLNAWLTVARFLYPRNDIRSAIKKALLEQVIYSPCAMVSFYFGMSLLEGKTAEEAKQEVKNKFFPTYQVGVVVWPVLQVVNYTMVPEKNRIPFVSICSLGWSSFLAYMNHCKRKNENIKSNK
ncbi:PXMP2/4 family protein 4-like [Daktulosphaira vitifoliae]|uniref:PXMP2/4 family protein 4-like n=1 Tax=Daktulosphaira vitifoliae TaxID=58002 RepID=UPI0021AAB1BE|nr:PXMP2/4 family protein 4-like [Daktulosphaira vitifoliae]